MLFTPYHVGERTPHADSVIRGSFIGLDGSHGREHLIRSVLEGITFSLNESVALLRKAGFEVWTVVSIGAVQKMMSGCKCRLIFFRRLSEADQ